MRTIAIALLAGLLLVGCGGSGLSTSNRSATNAGVVKSADTLVPRVTDLSWSKARRELRRRNLEMQTTALSGLCAGLRGGGRIMLQEPRPGTSVKPRTLVRVQTSCHR